MATTYYSYIYRDQSSLELAIINSSEVALPKPEVGNEVSVNAGKTVSGVISRVTVDIVQDMSGNRSLTYQVEVS